MKLVFFAYNHKDCVIARMLYQYLSHQHWQDVTFFLDEISITPGENWENEVLENARKADLGIVILSEYTHRSQYVPQEIGILLGRRVPVIYVAMHEEWRIPPGYERTIKSFPLYEYKSPIIGCDRLAEVVLQFLGIGMLSEQQVAKRQFENRHMQGRGSVVLSKRDAYVMVHAIKCAEFKLRVLAVNALQQIHGGFVYIQRLLSSNGQVRILLLDYNCESFTQREEAEKASRSGCIRADWIASVGNLIELERMRNGKGIFEVRCRTKPAKGSLIIIDDWLAHFSPYEPANMGGRPCFTHEASLWLNHEEGRETFRDYYEMFESSWDDPKNTQLDLGTLDVRKYLPKRF